MIKPKLFFTVTPSEEQECSKENWDSIRYEVIHGRHRLMALKEIENMGRLEELVGMRRKRITCIVMNVKTAEDANFGNIRGNIIQAAFTRHPYLHELVYIYRDLLQSLSSEKCEDIMMRYGKFLAFGVDDLTALKKIGKMSKEGLQVMADFFHLYESFKTLDANEAVKRKSSLIMAGKPMQVPNVLFRQLVKVDDEFLVSSFAKVKNKSMSLKDVVTQYNILLARSKVASSVVLELGSKSIEEARVLFPGKLEDATLDSFLGANVGKNSKNQKGADLKSYCQSLLQDKVIGPLFTYKVVDSVLTMDYTYFRHFNTIVFNVKYLSSWFPLLECIIGLNDHASLIMLFSNEEDQNKASTALSSTHAKKVLQPCKIYFLKDSSSHSKNSDFHDNMVFGILCAKAIYKPPVKIFNGDICNLEHVVNQLSPPDSANCFVNEGDLKIIKVHTRFACTYVGQGSAVHKFMIESSSKKTDSSHNDESTKSIEDISSQNPEISSQSPEKFNPIAMSSFLEGSDVDKASALSKSKSTVV